MTSASTAVVATAAAILALNASSAGQSHVSTAQLFGQRFGFSSSQLAAVDAGTPVAVVVPSNVGREVVVAGAVFVHATAPRLVSVLQDVERLESGHGFIRTKRLSDPPRLADFAGLQLPVADVEALRDCRPGRCNAKMSWTRAWTVIGRLLHHKGNYSGFLPRTHSVLGMTRIALILKK